MLQERARIARELHDSVLQTLYAITLTASRARRLLELNGDYDVQRLIDDVLQLADAGQSELRALLANIRSDLLTSAGLTAALARLAADVRTRNGLDVRLSLAGEPDMPVATKEALAWISREALHNVVRHAGADRVDIVLEVCGREIVLLIIDNGRGFDPAAFRPGHFGLQSMRERTATIGGALELASADGVGTQIRVCIPDRVDRDG
jgi:signal transduction histidine kinase